MQTSILIAKLIGPLLVVAGLTGFANPKALQEIAREILASRAQLFTAGILALLAGLAIVNSHNHWTGGWPVVITVFGWLAVVGGILRIGFPAVVKTMAESMLARPGLLRALAALQVFLGAFLMYQGYL